MKEIDSSVLISYLAQKSLSDDVTISIRKIRKIGHIIEERHPSYIIDMDKYSIESFRIKSKGSVVVNGQELHFSRKDEAMKGLLQRTKPSDRLEAMLEEISKEEDV